MIFVKAKLQSPMQRSHFLFFFLISLCSYSQIKSSIFIDGKLKEHVDFKDSVSLAEHVRNFKVDAVSNGAYFAGLDSIVRSDSGLNIHLHYGNKVDFEVTGVKKKNLHKHIQNRIKYLSNTGYPFASITIDSTRIVNGDLKGRIVESRGPYILNEPSFFYSEIKTKTSYIHQLLDHVPGEHFRESGYKRINEKIQRSPFLNFKRPVDISFQNEKAKLYLDIEEIPSSTFEGVLGLQQQGENSSVVGSIDLDVQNLFNSGKELAINWESFAGGSQNLAFTYSHPFFLGSKLTPDFKFNLLKQDSIFLNRSVSIDIGTYVSPTIEAKLGYTGNNGSLLSREESTLLEAGIADYKSDLYRITLEKGSLDFSNTLESKSAWQVGVSLGTKRISKNVNLPEAFYDTLQLKTDIFKFDLKSIFNRNIFKRQQFSLLVAGGLFVNEERLNNERYRLGGLRTIRGFNEKEFFADRYLLTRTEYRSFFEKGSYFYLFYDQLLYEIADSGDTPWGTGLGFLLATLSGQFNFALAVGKSDNQQVDFSNMKVHFGYITKF